MNLDRRTAQAYQAFAAGDYGAAAQLAAAVLRESPDDPGASTLMGRLALVSGDPDVAREFFARVLHNHPENVALWLDLALALRDLGRPSAALEAAERALALDARSAKAWIHCGELRLSLNERERAGDAFRRALKIEPESVPALRGVAQTDSVAAGSELAARMEALAGSPAITQREAAELHYALAQIHRRAGAHAEFIRHLLTANVRQRALCADGRPEYAAMFDRLDSAFTADAFERAARAGPVAPTPIFVVGMPRSGTTLVEQMLAAHPDVAAGGELDYMRRPLRRALERATSRPYPQGFETLAASSVNAIAQAYARRLRFIGDEARYVVDKTPGNYHLLGLLRMLFPEAPIIHVTRDPLDTCFSILQYPFDDRSPHTCDMQLLAYAYGRYVRLMQRWHELFPRGYITVEYERLVRAPAEEGRRLFEYCGLQWDDQYLDFHRAANPSRTFSTLQVRRAIYTSSIGAWRPYADALAPLCQALEFELRSARSSVLSQR